MLVVIGRGVMTVGTKYGYWGRLRALAAFSFNSTFKSYKKLKDKIHKSASGQKFNKFLSSKYAKGGSGLIAAEVAWQALNWLLSEDEILESQNKMVDRLGFVSSNYKADTFVKMVQHSLEADKVLENKLRLWNVKLFVVAGANDKSCRVLVKGKLGEPKVMSSFCVGNWIDKYKPEGDLRRLSDVLEWEYFHSFHQPKTGFNRQQEPKAFRDNVLISDKINKTMLKSSMAYSAILYDLLRLSKGSDTTLDTSRLPTMGKLNGNILKELDRIKNGVYSNEAVKKIWLTNIASSDIVDMSGISRSELLKRMILDSVANTDYQDAAILYLANFMESYSRNRHAIILPTKFESKEFDENGLRSEDGYKAFIVAEDEDLDKLSEVLVDGRSKISKSPGMNKDKLKKFGQFTKNTINKVQLAKKAANGDVDALDSLIDSLTSGGK